MAGERLFVKLFEFPMKNKFAIAIILLGLNPAFSPGANLLLNSGFESFTSGVPNSWTYTQGDGPASLLSASSSFFTNINPAGASSTLFTDGSTTTATPLLLQSFTAQTSGILNVAWDFRLNTMTGNPWSVQIDDSTSALIKLNMDGGGNLTVDNNGGGTTTVTSLQTNTWYQVQLALNLDAHTLSGSITSQSFTTTPISSQTWRLPVNNVISRVVLLDDSVSAAQAGNIQFDNIAVDRTAFAPAPEPSAFLLLGLGGLFVAGRRRR